MYGIVARFDGRGARAVRDLDVTRDLDVVYFIVDVFDDAHCFICLILDLFFFLGLQTDGKTLFRYRKV